MTKRMIAVVLSIVMLLASTGCSSQVDNGPDTNSDSENTTTAPPAQGGSHEMPPQAPEPEPFQYWEDSAVNTSAMENTSLEFSRLNWAMQGKTLYYVTNSQLFRIDTTGKNHTQIIKLRTAKNAPMDDVHNIIPVGKTVYFINDDVFYALDTESESLSVLSEDYNDRYHNDRLYYRDGLFYNASAQADYAWTSTDGTERTVILDKFGYTISLDNAVFADGYLYVAGNYFDTSEHKYYNLQIIRVSADGSEVLEIVDDTAIRGIGHTYHEQLGSTMLFGFDKMCLHNGQLYIFGKLKHDQSVSCVLRCNPDGTNLECLSAEYPDSNVGYVDGYFYADGEVYDFTKIDKNTTWIDWDAIRIPYKDVNEDAPNYLYANLLNETIPYSILSKLYAPAADKVLTIYTASFYPFPKYECSYSVPWLNIPGAEAVNQELYRYYQDTMQDVLHDKTGIMVYNFEELNYLWGEKDYVLSLLLHESKYEYDDKQDTVYNISLVTGQQISNEEVVKLFGYSWDEFEEKAKAAITEDWDSRGSSGFEVSLDRETMDSIKPYIDEDGSLWFSVNVYHSGGNHYLARLPIA